MVAQAGAPKTLLLDKIEAAVRALAEPAGSSRVAILKFLKSQYGLDFVKKALSQNAFKNALTKGVDGRRLVQKGQAFTVPGV